MIKLRSSDQASAVLDLLRYELKKHQVEEFCGSEVVSIEFSDGEFRIVLNNSHIHFARRVILAAGGRAAPLLGSNGTGYSLARMLGHKSPVVTLEKYNRFVPTKAINNFMY